MFGHCRSLRANGVRTRISHAAGSARALWPLSYRSGTETDAREGCGLSPSPAAVARYRRIGPRPRSGALDPTTAAATRFPWLLSPVSHGCHGPISGPVGDNGGAPELDAEAVTRSQGVVAPEPAAFRWAFSLVGRRTAFSPAPTWDWSGTPARSVKVGLRPPQRGCLDRRADRRATNNVEATAAARARERVAPRRRRGEPCRRGGESPTHQGHATIKRCRQDRAGRIRRTA
jgi:hypothetical protein